MRVNGGFPYITVEDGDYLRNGELYLKHYYEGIELDITLFRKCFTLYLSIMGKSRSFGNDIGRQTASVYV